MKKKAVSLRYPENADAPFISACAQGLLAEKMIKIAQQNDIPIVQDEILTNVLLNSNPGDLIPEETYSVVANIFAFILKLEDKDNGKTIFES